MSAHTCERCTRSLQTWVPPRVQLVEPLDYRPAVYEVGVNRTLDALQVSREVTEHAKHVSAACRAGRHNDPKPRGMS